jgi:hypothetical protein
MRRYKHSAMSLIITHLHSTVISHGIYHVFLDGATIGKPVDLYSADVVPSQAKLGKLDLAAGEHTLRFECTGKSDASKGYFFGMDMIELLPTK